MPETSTKVMKSSRKNVAKVTHCKCGKVMQHRSERCRTCYHKVIAHRNKIYAKSMAAARAGVTWRKRISKLETKAKELLEVLRLPFEGQVAMGTFTIDFLLPEHMAAVEVYSEYWHRLPSAMERDQRREAELKAKGYKVVILWGDREYLWWQVLRDSLALSL